ncbi:unnamed protein product [Orchesella dallaii]|uniref:Uncharacterized protein n=1 Tax=Orchesella dallaii TaxID=48710 RepID=A0ABP1RST7_9HEXA
MGIDLNSKVGLLKIATVILLLSSLIPVYIAYFNSDYLYPARTQFQTPEDHCNDVRKIFPERSSCPQTWMATVAIIIISIAFFASFIILIVLIFVDLGSIFKTIDFIGHIVGGVLVLIAGIFVVVLAIQTFNLQSCVYQCSGKPEQQYLFCRESESVCVRNREQTYYPITALIAGIFAVFGGIVYVVTGILLHKQ